MIGTIISVLTGGLLDKVTGLAHAYLNKEITKSEFESRVKIAHEDATAKMDMAWTAAQADMQESLMATIRVSPVMQKAFAVVLFMQVFVLVWYQIGTPCYQIITGTPFPEPMANIEWAYLLVGGMTGVGAYIFKARG